MTDTIRIPIGPSGKRVAWALIDGEDYERTIEHSWYLNPHGYAFAPKAVEGKSVFLHGFIVGRLDEGDKLHVDHWNRDKLDNRKRNLRVITCSENILNSERHDGREEKVSAVRRLRSNGATTKEAAKVVGVSTSAARLWTADFPSPELRGASGGATYRAVERGIYQRQYKTTGLVLPGLFVNDLNARTFRRFETLEEAQEYRASDVWRRPRSNSGHRALKTHCKRGHAYDADNTYADPRGYRQCRACNRIAAARYYQRTRLAAA